MRIFTILIIRKNSMRKSDFIKVFKVSILIDLGIYFMALIKNGFKFHNVDILNMLSANYSASVHAGAV